MPHTRTWWCGTCSPFSRGSHDPTHTFPRRLLHAPAAANPRSWPGYRSPRRPPGPAGSAGRSRPLCRRCGGWAARRPKGHFLGRSLASIHRVNSADRFLNGSGGGRSPGTLAPLTTKQHGAWSASGPGADDRLLSRSFCPLCGTPRLPGRVRSGLPVSLASLPVPPHPGAPEKVPPGPCEWMVTVSRHGGMDRAARDGIWCRVEFVRGIRRI